MASAAAALDGPIGPVSTDFRDLEGLRRSTRTLKEWGFSARSVIHPSQVAPVNEVFSPDPEEMEEAHRMVAQADIAAAAGHGAFIGEDGTMIDEAMVRRARGLLEEAMTHERPK